MSRPVEPERLTRELLEQRRRLRALSEQLSSVRERERRRIATGLHDHVGQLLALARAKTARLLQSEPPEDAADSLTSIQSLLDQAIESVRSLTFELGSSTLHERGLEAALRELGRRISGEYGIGFRFEGDGALERLPGKTRAVLFRTVRELVLNVVAHARARNVTVSVRSTGGRLKIAVTDDGVGFDPASARARPDSKAGFGLFSVREGLGRIGGALEIRSTPGLGTRAVVVAPRHVRSNRRHDRGLRILYGA